MARTSEGVTQASVSASGRGPGARHRTLASLRELNVNESQIAVLGDEKEEVASLSWRVAILEGVGIATTLAILSVLVLSRFDVPVSYGTIGGSAAFWVIYRRWHGPYRKQPTK